MEKKCLIILAEGYEEIEAIACIDILRRANIQTTVAGLNNKKVMGSHKITILADNILKECDIASFDAIILPGGMPGSKNLAASLEVQTILTQMNNAGKIIAAICAAPPLVLLPTGILNNRKATCYPSYQTKIEKAGEYIEDNVVVDNNLITSRGAGTSLLFALTIVEKLMGPETAELLRQGILLT